MVKVLGNVKVNNKYIALAVIKILDKHLLTVFVGHTTKMLISNRYLVKMLANVSLII